MNLLTSVSSQLKKSLKASNFQEGFASIKNTIKNTSSRVTDIFGEFIPFHHDSLSTKSSGFKAGIPIKSMIASAAMGISMASAGPMNSEVLPPQENIFRSGVTESAVIPEPMDFMQFPASTQSARFASIEAKRLSKQEIERPLASLQSTDFFLKSRELPILIETEAYTPDGKFVENLLKGTRVMIDGTKPVLVGKDAKTYAHVSGHNNTGVDVIESFLVRTPWLDSEVKSSRASKVTQKLTQKKNHFDGYIGYNGKEIPGYILESVTMNYFGTILAPRIQTNLVKKDIELAQTREQVKKEYLQDKKPIDEIASYAKHKSILAKKHALTQVNQAIRSFTVNGSEALVNPDVRQILASLQKTPEWQRLIQKATAATSLRK